MEQKSDRERGGDVVAERERERERGGEREREREKNCISQDRTVI